MEREIEPKLGPPTDKEIDRIPVEARMVFPDASTNGALPTAAEFPSSGEALARALSGVDGGKPSVVAGSREPGPDQIGSGLAAPVEERRSQRDTNGKIERDDKRIKLSLEVTPELNRVIEHIADATGATKSEAIRKAIVLMEVAVEAKENGERLYVGTQPPPGTSREIIGL
jgi:hypothetical protein